MSCWGVDDGMLGAVKDDARPRYGCAAPSDHCASMSLLWIFSSWLKDQAVLLIHRLRIGTINGKTYRVDDIYQLAPRCFPANNIEDVLGLRPRMASALAIIEQVRAPCIVDVRCTSGLHT